MEKRRMKMYGEKEDNRGFEEEEDKDVYEEG